METKVSQEISKIRNFCVIAHIDHGKSTLADRFLEVTDTVSKREMREQILDQMDLERERGITIKLQPVRMRYKGYELNLIDTPGHVDFAYEVSRSLAAVEGVILLVDATQGIEAQTLANLYAALEQDLTIIPVINKIDLPNAETDRVRDDIVKLLGCDAKEVLSVSAKTGNGVNSVLDAVIHRIPVPKGDPSKPLQILIFDSFFDDYRGVIAYGRVFNGSVRKGSMLKFFATKQVSECLDVGTLQPKMKPGSQLSAGQIGYITTGLRHVQDCRVGDTITLDTNPAEGPLSGYQTLKPMVYAGLYCKEGHEYPKFRDAVSKVALNDASLTYEPDHSEALGFGFRCGFLGVLHLEIFQERLTREYNLDLIVTAPSVGYRVLLNEAGIQSYKKRDKQFNKSEFIVTSPLLLPPGAQIETVEEPWVSVDIVTPSEYIGTIMTFVQEKSGVFLNTEYLDEQKAVLHYEVPLASILVDFYDKLKSISAGYASLNYDFLEYRKCVVTRLDIIVAEDPIEALSTIVYQDGAYKIGRKIVDSLKDSLPRQLFEVKIQATIGGKVIASSRISAMRKDVTAKLYGGDVTRKRKLLEKQKKGKKRMRKMGKVDIPQEAFLAVLKR